jgi:hypothetical protein
MTCLDSVDFLPRDASIGHTALDESTLKNMINIDLSNIKKWGDTWLVKFNPNKTEIMIFNIRNQQDELSFDFDGIVLNSVNKHKHLGIIFSSECKWTKHIDSLIQRTSKQLNVLRKLKFRLKREYLENIYFTFIRPILEYSSEVWDNCGQVNSDRLEKTTIGSGLYCYRANMLHKFGFNIQGEGLGET